MKLATLFASVLFFSTVIAGPQKLENFGTNPGDLQASLYAPSDSSKALVVLLHGCGQNAEWLADHTGLIGAAQKKQFALLLPQQNKANNIQLCFNWFSPADQLAGEGETTSIMNMIAKARQQTKAEQVYLIGLSAGGAMATSIVAQYPEQFEAAGIIAGVGYPCADTLVKALSCMKSGSTYAVADLATRVQKLHEGTTQWPDMVVIAGSEDAIVSAKNSEQIYAQWQIILGANKQSTTPDNNAPLAISRHTNQASASYIELVMIAGLGHGWPVNKDAEHAGKAAPFILESALNTTDYLLKTWQL